MRKLLSIYKSNRVNLSNEQMINILLISIITIMPFIVTKSLRPFYLSGKVYYIYIIVFILLGLSYKNILKEIKIEEKICISFIITIMITFVFSNFKNIAFFGTDLRKEGLLMIVTYCILFFISIRYCMFEEKIIKFILFIPNIMSIYSLLQFYGIDPLLKYLDNTLGVSSMGFIGNRNFYGTYILIFLIANFSMYVLRGNKNNLVNSCVQFIGLICSLTRSCWVAFLVVSVIGVILIYKDYNMIKRATIIFITFLLIFFSINITSNNSLTGRIDTLIDSTVNISESSGSGRILIWKIVGELIEKNPILGEGPDTLRDSIIRYIPKSMEEYYNKYNTQIDKAHNEYLELWVSCGLFTMLTYVSLILIIGIKILKKIYITKYKILFLVFIAYTIQAFFNISVPMVAPIWWIFLGYCVQCYRKDNIEENEVKLI